MGDAFYASGDYFSEVVEDGAAPKITATPAGGTFTGSKSVSLASSESGSLFYTFTGSANSGSTLYSLPFSINSNTTLSVFTQDIWTNSRTTNFVFTFQCPLAAPVNGTISGYPSCVVTCDSGYQLNGGLCTAILPPASGGGGGGGGGGG